MSLETNVSLKGTFAVQATDDAETRMLGQSTNRIISLTARHPEAAENGRDTSVHQHEARKKSWRQKLQFLKRPFEVGSKSESIPGDSLLNCLFYFIFTAWSECFSVCSKHFLYAVSKIRKTNHSIKVPLLTLMTFSTPEEQIMYVWGLKRTWLTMERWPFRTMKAPLTTRPGPP